VALAPARFAARRIPLHAVGPDIALVVTEELAPADDRTCGGGSARPPAAGPAL